MSGRGRPAGLRQTCCGQGLREHALEAALARPPRRRAYRADADLAELVAAPTTSAPFGPRRRRATSADSAATSPHRTPPRPGSAARPCQAEPPTDVAVRRQDQGDGHDRGDAEPCDTSQAQGRREGDGERGKHTESEVAERQDDDGTLHLAPITWTSMPRAQPGLGTRDTTSNLAADFCARPYHQAGIGRHADRDRPDRRSAAGRARRLPGLGARVYLRVASAERWSMRSISSALSRRYIAAAASVACSGREAPGMATTASP